MIQRVCGLRREGRTQDEIAVECGMAQGTVSVILRRRGLGGKLMQPKRYLGKANLKSEGEPTRFDEGTRFGNYVPRGAGQTMRGDDLAKVWLVDGLRWFVVRDKFCSYDIDDEEAEVWTLSRAPGEPGWETDGGFGGYGLTYAEARELADAANAARGPRDAPGGATGGASEDR